MAQLYIRVVILAAWLCQGVVSDMRWREALLEQARTRIQSWYTDPDMTEAPQTRNGIAIRMLKNDVQCGDASVPVTFAEFDVAGARPIDVFNTMLDISGQTSWNHVCNSATPLGDFLDHGVRGLAAVFNIPVVSDREFVQWQAADANFDKQDFWVVFSTQQNEELHKRSHLQQGAVDAQNCLAAYHITNTPNGAHVILTQHVNVHPALPLPLHQIMDFFPAAWQGTIDFVNQLSGNARKLAKKGSSSSQTVAPAFMLERDPSRPLPNVVRTSFLSAAEAFPKPQRTAVAQPRFSLFQSIPLMLLFASSVGFVSFSIGRTVGKKIRAMRHQAFIRIEVNAESDQEVLIA